MEEAGNPVWQFPWFNQLFKYFLSNQARIAQLVAYRLGTGEVPGSNTDDLLSYVICNI